VNFPSRPKNYTQLEQQRKYVSIVQNGEKSAKVFIKNKGNRK
jgi:hypothetical protein